MRAAVAVFGAFALVAQVGVTAQSAAQPDNFDALAAALFSRGGNELTQQKTLSLAVGHIVSELSGFPRVTTAGSFRSTLGGPFGFERLASTFAPTFTLRAFTVGRGRFDLGFNYQHVAWSKLDGLQLRDGFVQDFYRPDIGGTDLTRMRTSLSLSYDAFTSIVNLGVTDRIDVGVAIPLATVRVDVVQTIRGGFGLLPGTVPSDELPMAATNEAHSSATGLGDVVGHLKYSFVQRRAIAAAAAIEVKAANGDHRQLLGNGAAAVKLLGVTSFSYRNLTVHANAGRVFKGSTEFADESRLLPLAFDILTTSPPDETVYSLAAEASIGSRATFIGEVIGRHVADYGRVFVTRDHYQPGAPSYYQDSLTIQPFVPLDAVNVSFGVKVSVPGVRRVFSHVLAHAAIVSTVSNGGLIARLSPIVSAEFGLR